MKQTSSLSHSRGYVHINLPCQWYSPGGKRSGKFASECLKVKWNAALVFLTTPKFIEKEMEKGLMLCTKILTLSLANLEKRSQTDHNVWR